MKHLITFLAIVNLLITKAQVPRHIELKELGISFDLPEGWKGQMQEDYIVAGHSSIPGLIMVFENEAQSLEATRVLAMQGLYEEEITLTPKADFQIVEDKQVEGYFEGNYEGSEVQGFAIGLVNPQGTGVSTLILTNTEQFGDLHVQEVRKLTQSVQFSKPVDHELVTFWKDRVIGYKLKYMYSYQSSDVNGGYINSRINIDIDLCTNGKFYYSDSRYTSIDTGQTETGTTSGTSKGENDNQGVYEIFVQGNTPYLELVSDSGKERLYSLAITSDDVPLLNDDKYYVDYSNKCQ